ncbi:MAG TPA: ABC transporter substrate-binding protein [Stellaceae bacterium]|nr:ABC transporter substrate-binding protein [Stellaceae bacterium]
MRFKALLPAVGAAVLALMLPGPARALETIKMSYTAVSGFTLGYVAQQEGFFKKRGLDVDFVQTAISGNIPGAIVSGSVEIGGPTMPSVLQADDAGLDLVVIAGGAVYPLTGDVLVARPGSGIKKPADLKGKTVGVPGLGALLDIMLRRNLKANHVDPSSVKFVEVGFPQAADALKSGQIDAYPAQAPFTARILQSGAGYAVSDWLKDTPDGTLTVVYATTRKWAAAHKPAIAALRAGMEEAQAFVKTHKDAADAAVAKYTGLPAKVVASIPLPPFNVNVTPKQIQFWIDVCKEQHLIKGNPDAKSLLFE